MDTSPIGFRSRSSLLDLLGSAGGLQDLDRQALIFVARNGSSTKLQIEDALGRNGDEINETLERLVSQELLTKLQRGSLPFYIVKESLRTRRLVAPEKFPASPVIPLVYHYNLLSDASRMEGLRIAIASVVNKGDLVADLGCGVGVLSILAAQKGGYVFAVEVDPEVAAAAEFFIKNHGLNDRIRLINKDVREVLLPELADVCICEMMDTALINELQVPIMNYALRNLLKPSARVIPFKAETKVQVVSTDYGFAGLEFPIPFFEAYDARQCQQELSPFVSYHSIKFNELNSDMVDVIVPLPISGNGIANGVRIVTTVWLTPEISLGSSPWLNPPLVLPLDALKVAVGDILSIRLNYQLGGGLGATQSEWHIEGGKDDC